jgi:hypothetical protein
MAWTITQTVDERVGIKTAMGERLIIVKLACVSDASASGTVDIEASVFREIRGSWLYLVKFEPGTGDDAPTGTFDFDVEDKNNVHILDTDANTNTANSFVSGSDTLGVFPPVVHDLSVVIGTLGNANTADIYMYFTK